MSTLHQVRRILSRTISNRRFILPRHRSSTIAPKLPPPRWGFPPLYTWLHENWYHDPTLTEPWSTEWEDWSTLETWFIMTVDGKRAIDHLRDTWALPGPIEPIAYGIGEGFYFLFCAGGRYYYWADAHLTMHRKKFASHKAFMRYLVRHKSHMPDVEIPMREGGSMDWWSKYSIVGCF